MNTPVPLHTLRIGRRNQLGGGGGGRKVGHTRHPDLRSHFTDRRTGHALWWGCRV